jgi:hypothetical protein
MGTRGLTVVKIGGETKVAQYGQWDHYPEGQGLTALRFLREPANRRMLSEKAPHVTQISEDQHKTTWVAVGADPDSNMVSLDVAKKHTETFPELSRDTGAKILSIVADRPQGIALNLEPEFAEDGLFCEGIFTVDFDANTFSYHREGYIASSGEHEGFPPVVFPLDNLPSDPGYLARIIASEVFDRAGIESSTGAGLALDWMEGQSNNDVYVDMRKMTVSTGRHKQLAYDDFLALGLGEHGGGGS